MKKDKSKKELQETKNSINQIKELYSDFSETMKEVLGDAGEFVMKHKFLILIAFVIYLWHRNSHFTIKNFVEGLEKKLLDRENDE